jgi:hypothetical protein
MIDITARHIYDHSPPDAINSWLRTLASIRSLAVIEIGQRRPA